MNVSHRKMASARAKTGCCFKGSICIRDTRNRTTLLLQVLLSVPITRCLYTAFFFLSLASVARALTASSRRQTDTRRLLHASSGPGHTHAPWAGCKRQPPRPPSRCPRPPRRISRRRRVGALLPAIDASRRQRRFASELPPPPPPALYYRQCFSLALYYFLIQQRKVVGWCRKNESGRRRAVAARGGGVCIPAGTALLLPRAAA